MYSTHSVTFVHIDVDIIFSALTNFVKLDMDE